MSDPSVKDQLSFMRGWFASYSQEQRTLVLSILQPYLTAANYHWLAEKLPSHNLHAFCASDCCDIFKVLPSMTAQMILNYLDADSLAACLRVCRRWYTIVSSAEQLWKLHAVQLSPYLAAKSTTSWRSEFRLRRHLAAAWAGSKFFVRNFDGHTGGVTCIAFDGSRIVSGSHDQTIRVWNMKTNSKMASMTLAGHSGAVRTLCLRRNRLVSGSNDKTVKVWDLDIKANWSMIGCKVTMVGHTDIVRSVDMYDDEDDEAKSFVISSSYDHTIRVWSLPGGVCTFCTAGHRCRVLTTCVLSSKILFSGAADGAIKVWQVDQAPDRTLVCRASRLAHTDSVTSLATVKQIHLFNSDVSNSDAVHLLSAAMDCTIRVWSVDCHNLSDVQCIQVIQSHSALIRCLASSGARFASASDDKTIQVWTLARSDRQIQFESTAYMPVTCIESHTDGVTCVAFDHLRLVSGSYDKTVKMCDFTSCSPSLQCIPDRTDRQPLYLEAREPSECWTDNLSLRAGRMERA